jgi:hypothetical protein
VVYLYMDSLQGALGPAWREVKRRLRRRQPGVGYEPEPLRGVEPVVERVRVPEL